MDAWERADPWKRRLWRSRFADDQAVYIRHKEVIHSIPYDGQSARLKTIIRSSQSMQSEIRPEVYGKISTNAILTFNFFFDRSKSSVISLVRLSPWKSFREGCVLSGGGRQEWANRNVVLFCPLLHRRISTTEV